MGGNPPSTGRQRDSEIGSRARADSGSRTERRQTWVFQNQLLSEDGRRQRRDRGLRGDSAD